MKISPNFGLNLPEGNDVFDYKKFLTDNLTKIDTYLNNTGNEQNVVSYGAKGDGVADDTQAIKNAIAYVTSLGGGIVRIPKGTYKTTSTITVPPKVSLIGEGSNKSVLRYTGTGKCIIFGDPNVTGFPAQINAKISDLQIIGNGMDKVGTVGIYLVKSLFAVIERVYVLSMESGFILDGKELWNASNSLYDPYTSGVKYGLTLTADTGPTTYGQTNHTNVFGGYFYGNSPVIPGSYGVKIIAGDSNSFFGTAAEGVDTGVHIVSDSPMGHRFFGLRTEATGANRDIVCENGSIRNVFIGCNGTVNYNGQGSEGWNTEIAQEGTFPVVPSLDWATAANRTKIVRTQGGTGEADHIYVSRKKEDGSFEWASLINEVAPVNPDITGRYILSPSGIPFKPSVTDAGVTTWAFIGKAYDLFDRANSTTTLGSANIGGAWTVTTGTFGILANQAYSVSDNQADKALLPTVGTGDYTISCDLLGTLNSYTAYSSPQILMRFIDDNNYMKVYLQNDTIWLEKQVGGVDTVLNYFSGGVSTPDNTYHRLTVELKGTKITISLNGAVKGTHTLTGAEQTLFGTKGVVGMRLMKTGAPAYAAKWNNLVII